MELVWPDHGAGKCSCVFAVEFNKHIFDTGEPVPDYWVAWFDRYGSKQMSLTENKDEAEAYPTEALARECAEYCVPSVIHRIVTDCTIKDDVTKLRIVPRRKRDE